MVWILVLLGVLVGMAMLSLSNDVGCLGGWLFIALVIFLGFVAVIGR